MQWTNFMTAASASGAKSNSKRASLIAVVLFALGSAAAKDLPKNADPSAPAAIAARRHELVISVPDRKLVLIENGEVVKVYAVAVGALKTPSPSGQFKVVNRIVKPTYYHKGRVIGPGRANPLGSRWMGLDLKGYGIHGTNEPRSIGHAASHGCIRMGKQDVEDLFNRVQVGDVVEIHRERPSVLARAFDSPVRAGANLKHVAESKAMSPALRAAIVDSF